MPFQKTLSRPLNLHLERFDALKRIGWQAMAQALSRAAENQGIANYVPGQQSLIALVDSGIEPHNEFAEDQIVSRHSVVNGSGDVTDRVGHGTALAGILVGSGTPGAGHGIAKGAKLVVIQVGVVTLDDGLVTPSVPTGQIAKALQWLLANREAIEQRTGRHLGAICLATAGGVALKEPSRGWYLTPTGKAIRSLRESGVLTVVGTGNSHHAPKEPTDCMHWPAILSECFSVGATYDAEFPSETTQTFCGLGTPTGATDGITCYSNRILEGPHRTKVFAPGSILTTTSAGGGSSLVDSNGTSSATPVVCASVVLVQELLRLRDPANLWPSAEKVETLIRDCAVPMEDASGRTYPLLSLAAIAQGKPEIAAVSPSTVSNTATTL